MDETTERPKDPNIEEARLHIHEARRAMRKSVEAWLPAGYLDNQRRARREFLMAMRSVINAAIDRMEPPSENH